MFDSLSLPASQLRWRLTGPDGVHLHMLLATLIGAGVAIESVRAGTTYRLNGPAAMLQELSDQLAEVEDGGFVLEPEPAPTDSVHLSSHVAPVPAYRRTVTLHGHAPAWRMVAAAIDAGLSVSSAGVNRWAVAARTATLLQWLAAVLGRTVDEARELLGLTVESAQAEDTPVPPFTVQVGLPARRTETELIARDDEGNLTRVVQRETTIEG